MSLRYDEIPAGRLPILDHASRLGDDLGVLGVALAGWVGRADPRPDAAARRAANSAMDAVGSMLHELHELRARLVAEIRASDNQAAARVDAMLARHSTEGAS